MIRSCSGPAVALLVCAPGAAADVHEILVGRDAAGRLQVRLEGDLPVELNPSVFPGFPGWAEGQPGFESTILDDPGDDFYIPSAAAELQWILLSIGPGIRVLNDTGSAPMAPGETFYVGHPIFDVHPFWHIAAGQPGITASIRIVIHDLSGLYTDSEELELTLTPAGCYANCDASTTTPILNVVDFSCFLNLFASGDPYANCDQSTTPPTLNVLDFSCFLNRFAAGCTL